MIHSGIDDYDHVDDFYHDRHEQSEYNRQFGLTYYGNYITNNLFENKLFLFINIFYEMILGYDPQVEIKFLIYR